MAPAFHGDCRAVLIGSMPLLDRDAANRLVQVHTPEVPVWAQLPQLAGEGMVEQFLPGMPGVKHGAARYCIDTADPAFDDALWTSGTAGVGYDLDSDYDSLLRMDVEAQMFDQRPGVYTRFEFEVEDLIAEEDMVVTISHTGYIKRLPATTYRRQNRGGRGVAGG